MHVEMNAERRTIEEQDEEKDDDDDDDDASYSCISLFSIYVYVCTYLCTCYTCTYVCVYTYGSTNPVMCWSCRVKN
jgi:hypothetical protein